MPCLPRRLALIAPCDSRGASRSRHGRPRPGLRASRETWGSGVNARTNVASGGVRLRGEYVGLHDRRHPLVQQCVGLRWCRTDQLTSRPPAPSPLRGKVTIAHDRDRYARHPRGEVHRCVPRHACPLGVYAYLHGPLRTALVDASFPSSMSRVRSPAPAPFDSLAGSRTNRQIRAWRATSYSVRNAIVGSMLSARRVGTTHASMQTPSMTIP